VIISEPRKPLDSEAKGKIVLPVWALAPLYLNRGARLWGVYGTPDRQIRSKTVELVATTIPDNHWGDVWRLEITTDDKVSNLTKMMDIFASKRIEVLFAEGSVHSFAKYNSMSFVISLLNYSSSRDGDAESRLGANFCIVPDLEFWILSNFADQIVFNDSGYPRFKLKRINLYRLMNQAMSVGKYHLISKGRDTLLEEGYRFSPNRKFFDRLERLGDRIFYTSAVDTKNRCIRILFFPSGEDSIGHLQFIIPSLDSVDLYSATLYRLFKIVSDRQGNVIRHQIRKGLPKGAGGKLERYKKNERETFLDATRLDLTIEAQRASDSVVGLLDAIVKAVERDHFLKEHCVDIRKIHPEIKSSSKNGEKKRKK
jgi:hypothetical protein